MMVRSVVAWSLIGLSGITESALATPPQVFRMAVPPGGPAGMASNINVPAIYPDSNCDGVLDVQDAIWFADQCVRYGGSGNGNVYVSTDCPEVRGYKAVAAAEAFLFLAQYSGGSSSGTIFGGGTSPVTLTDLQSCTSTRPNPTITCSGMAIATSAAIVQHLAGVAYLPAASAPSLPGNVLASGPLSLPGPRIPSGWTAPLDSTSTLNLGSSPCTLPAAPTNPSDQKPILPGGDTPLYCAGVLGSTGPCSIPAPDPVAPDHPDIVYCSGIVSTTSLAPGSCDAPAVTPGSTPPIWPAVPPMDGCAGTGCGNPTCAEMQCDERPSPGTKPGEICAGSCNPGPTTPRDIYPKTPGDSCAGSGLCSTPKAPPLPAPAQGPPVWCQPESVSSAASAVSPSTGSAPSFPNPVDLVYRYKLEQDTDITISLAGSDFSIVRHYSSNPWDIGSTHAGAGANPGLFGPGWSSPLFQQLLPDTDTESTDLILRNGRANAVGHFKSTGTNTWGAYGPGHDVITIDSGDYLLYTPGRGSMLFHGNSSPFKGFIAWEEDEYGNRRTFEYRRISMLLGGVPTGETCRLHRVYLNGTGIEDCKGFVQFGYYVGPASTTSSPPPPTPPDSVNGRVARIMVYRKVGEDWTETHRLEYSYKRDGDGLSADVGTAGDLIQVVKYSFIDTGFGSSNEVDGEDRQLGPAGRRTSITQYRYHSGVQHPSEEALSLLGGDFEDVRFTSVGPAHALKAVFRPEQLEAYADRLQRDNPWVFGKAYSVRDAAYRLLLLRDRSTAIAPSCSERYMVGDLASKIIGYTGITDGTVSTEVVQTGRCSCEGPAQAVKYQFSSPGTWTSGSEMGKSTKIEEYIRTSPTADWSLYTTRYVDSQKIGGGFGYYRINDVLYEEGTSRVWVNHYKYDTTSRNLLEQWTPGAFFGRPGSLTSNSYSPATSTTAPSLTNGSPTPTLDGLVNYYQYNTEKWLTEFGVKNGGTSIPQLKISYPNPSSLGLNERAHLPTKIERITSDASSPTDDQKEKTEFEYTFWTGGSGNRVKSILAKVETELAVENGPASTATSMKLFDEQGQPIWSAGPDGTLLNTTFDPVTGRSTGVTVNAGDGALTSGGFSGTYATFRLANSLSSSISGIPRSISYTIERDVQGRILSITGPGPRSTTLTDQWAYGYGPITKPGRCEQWGTPFPYYIHLPASWVEGSIQHFAGPITVVWTNSEGAPIQVSQFNANPEVEYTRTHALALIADQSNSNTSLANRSEVSRTIIRRSPLGALMEYETWNDVVGAWARPSDQRSYKTIMHYDLQGRVDVVTSAEGEVIKTERDVLGRVTQMRRGTTETNTTLIAEFFYDADPAATTLVSGVGNGNLTVEVAHTGESGSADIRKHIYTYDSRDRLVSVQNPLPPHQFFVHDNLGRVVEAADFTGSAPPSAMTATSRGRHMFINYSQRGLPYRTRIAINPTDDGGGFLESHSWFDRSGRVMASWGPDSPAVKRTFDEFGRVAVEYVTDRNGDPTPPTGDDDGYLKATTVSDDVVLEQTAYDYADFGAVSMIRHLVRRHDAFTGSTPAPIQGPLTLPSGSDPGTGIATYTGFYYDGLGRLSRKVEFGTNRAPGTGATDDCFGNGTDPTAGSSAPWPSPNGPAAQPECTATDYVNHIVSGWAYDKQGRLDSTIDPKGRVSRVLYDDEDDTIATIENAIGTIGVQWDSTHGRWGVSGLSTDPEDAEKNRVTTMGVLKIPGSGEIAARWVSRRAAHFAATGESAPSAQVTEVVYGTTTGSGSLINTFVLPREIHYPHLTNGEPDSSAGNTVTYAYNVAGELTTATDRNNTVHGYAHDALGRVIGDGAAKGSAAIDDAITSISSTFDTMGRLTDVRSKDVADTVKNHVRYGYTALGLLHTIEQDVDSEIGASGTVPSRTVTYDFDPKPITATGSGVIPNSARVLRMHYPEFSGVADNETRLAFQYGVSESPFESVDRAIGRVSALTLEKQPDPGVWVPAFPIAEYTYLGLDAFSHVDMAMADVQLDRTIDRTGKRRHPTYPTSSTQTQAAGVYPGFDRFGRIKRQAWVLGDSSTNSGGSAPNMRELVNFAYYYDKAGNITHKRNDQQGAGALVAGPSSTTVDRWPDRDWVYSYDGLDRLTAAARGVIAPDDGTGTSGAFTSSTPPGLTLSKGSQQWKLDTLGNWNSFAIDFNNNGSAGVPNFDTSGTPGSEFQPRGTHNQQNQLPSLPGIPAVKSPLTGTGGGPAVTPYGVDGTTMVYDHNGSRTESGWTDPSTLGANNGFRFRYTYDCWNRLVKIARAPVTGSSTPDDSAYHPIAEYQYNGLSQRISKHTVGPNLGLDVSGVPVLKEQRYFYYDAAWRAIVEEIDDDNNTSVGTDRIAQQFFGLRGVNDAIFRREDRTTPGSPEIEDDPETEENEHVAAVPATGPNGRFDDAVDLAFYQLSDHQLSVVTTLMDVGATYWRIADEVEYDPYGNPRRTAIADVNRSGAVSLQDLFDFLTLYNAASPAADINNSGIVSIQDLFDFLSGYFEADSTPRDRISRSLIDNPYGYCGYYFDQETAAAKVLGPGGGALYQCRFRVYDPIAGRWLQQDPAGFVDGSNLYCYCGPDPYGLWGEQTSTGWANSDNAMVRSAGYVLGIIGGAAEGARDGVEIDINTLTLGQINPLNRDVQQKVKDNGTTYQAAQVSAIIGTTAAYAAFGGWALPAAAEALATPAALNAAQALVIRIAVERGIAVGAMTAFEAAVASGTTTAIVTTTGVAAASGGVTIIMVSSAPSAWQYTLPLVEERGESETREEHGSVGGVSRPGSVSGNPANRLVETGVPLKNGKGWVSRWTRMTAEEEDAQTKAIVEHYNKLEEESKHMTEAEGHHYRFKGMEQFRTQYRDAFLKNRNCKDK